MTLYKNPPKDSSDTYLFVPKTTKSSNSFNSTSFLRNTTKEKNVVAVKAVVELS